MSYYPYDPFSIRDATVEVLKTITGFAEVTYARTMPSTDTPLPFASVFFSGEEATAFGDADISVPKFNHRLMIDIGIMCNAANEAQLDDNINNLVEQTKDALFRSTDWLKMFNAFPSYRVEYSYPEKEEEYTVEAVIRLVVEFQSMWEPVLPNYFEGATVQTMLSDDKYSEPYVQDIRIRPS